MPDEDETPTQANSGEAASSGSSTRLTAGEIYDNVRVAAEDEMQRPPAALFWSAVAAGLTIGFSFLAGAYLSTLVREEYKTAASAAGYPLGFIFVVMARNQLFTENTLEPIIPLLFRPNLTTLKSLLSLWVIVLAGNLIGSIIFACLLAHTPMVEPDLKDALFQVAGHGTSGGFATVMWRSVFGGWLLALMAWMLASTRATLAQITLIWLTTAPIGAFDFRHSVAGAVEAFFRVWAGAASWGDMVGNFLVPAILGNIAGGFVFVALINHGQVAADRAAKESNGSGE